jgi:hypothetical protein
VNDSHLLQSVIDKSQTKSQVAKSNQFTQRFKSLNPNLKSNHILCSIILVYIYINIYMQHAIGNVQRAMRVHKRIN